MPFVMIALRLLVPAIQGMFRVFMSAAGSLGRVTGTFARFGLRAGRGGRGGGGGGLGEVGRVQGGGFDVRVESNVGECIGALHGVGREVQDALRRELRTVALDVAKDAQARAPVKTGKLKRSIRPFARVSSRGVSAGVRVSATNEGYPYPKRIEYGDGGRQAFLGPALREEAAAREIERRLVQAFDRAARRHGFR